MVPSTSLLDEFWPHSSSLWAYFRSHQNHFLKWFLVPSTSLFDVFSDPIYITWNYRSSRVHQFWISCGPFNITFECLLAHSTSPSNDLSSRRPHLWMRSDPFDITFVWLMTRSTSLLDDSWCRSHCGPRILRMVFILTLLGTTHQALAQRWPSDTSLDIPENQFTEVKWSEDF